MAVDRLNQSTPQAEFEVEQLVEPKYLVPQSIEVVGLFKGFRAPNATMSISLLPNEFPTGGTVSGRLLLTSDEEFEASEIRVELEGLEILRAAGDAISENIDDAKETRETRFYSEIGKPISWSTKGDASEEKYQMCKEKIVLARNVSMPKGTQKEVPFEANIPNLGPSYSGTRNDGVQLERTWTLKGVVSVGRRGDIEAKVPIRVI